MRRTGRGFTLIEVLVVMVIIAILVTLVSLSMRGDRAGESLEEEAKRLTALLNLLREEAVMRNALLGLARTPEGYLFVAQAPPDPSAPEAPPRFLPLADDGVFRPRVLPPGTRLDFEVGPAARPLPPRDTAYAPLLLALPQDALLPEGRLRLSHPATPRAVSLHVGMQGARWESGHERP